MTKTKLTPPAIVEIIFDLCYLCFAAGAGIYLLICAQANPDAMPGISPLTLYGAMALTLGFGDAFHLLPRVYSLWTNTMREHARALGFGKQVTSITMTLFYVMLFYAWQAIAGMKVASVLTVAVWVLAVIRIALCLLPQRQWYETDGSLRAAVVRNVPFALLGALVAVLYAIVPLPGFTLMPLAILLSFAFYFLVVLFAGKNPKMGAFMLPKTCVYVWIICMGFSML